MILDTSHAPDATAAHLIELTCSGQTDASSQVALYHKVLELLIDGEDDTLTQALQGAVDEQTRATLSSCIKTISTHWLCQPFGTAQKVLASLFLVPFTAMVAPGNRKASPLRLSDPVAMAALISQHQVIQDTAQIYLSGNILSMDELGSLTPSQCFGLTKRMCDSLATSDQLEIPLGPGVLALDHLQAAVVPYFLVGLAVSDSRMRMPSFYPLPAETGQRLTQEMTTHLAEIFSTAGFEAVVEVYPPELFPDAIDTGYYRAKLNALELQIGLQQHIHALNGAACTVILSVHDDGYIRISLHDCISKNMKLTFQWDIAESDDIGQSLADIEKAVRERGVADIRIIEGVQYTEATLHGEDAFPTLADLEHVGVTLQ